MFFPLWKAYKAVLMNQSGMSVWDKQRLLDTLRGPEVRHWTKGGQLMCRRLQGVCAYV